jgi:hypothetical protein
MDCTTCWQAYPPADLQRRQHSGQALQFSIVYAGACATSIVQASIFGVVTQQQGANVPPYVRELKEHRNLAAYWLATMHGSAPRVPSIEGLAARAGTFYLNLLRETRESTLEIIDHPILGGCDPTPYGQKTETAEKPVSLAASVAVSEAAQ